MSYLREFVDEYLGRKYATGLRDEPEEKYANGLVIRKDKRPKDVAAEPKANWPLGLGASVGKGGKNNHADVVAVQEALNKRLKLSLTVNGKCDAHTLNAIAEFQKLLGQFKPNGMFEPGRGPVRMLA